MRLLLNIPIKRKLIIITMLASGIALVVACLAFVTCEQVTSRKRIAQDLSITAAMTGYNSTSGLTFNDADSVQQTLKSLGAQPSIVHACVYDKYGRPFAQYQRADLGGVFSPPPVQRDGYQFGQNRLGLFQTISFDRERVGTVYIEMDLSEMTARVWRYTLIVGVVLLASSGLAFLLSTSLQKVISEPLAGLAQTVSSVAENKNYSVRAVKQGEDELGRLIDGFNHMLAQIQERDAALQESQTELENRVAERTRELANSLSMTRATLESTTDGILVTDGRETVTNFNEKFVEVFCFPRDLVRSMDDRKLLEAATSQVEDPQQFLSRIREINANPEMDSFDLLEFRDGRVFERYSRPQRVGDKTVGRVWSFHDVTERKRAEEARAQMEIQLRHAQKLESIGQLAAGIAHEINTPTQFIGDNLRFIQDAVREMNPVLEQHRRLLEAAKGQAATEQMAQESIATMQAADFDYLMAEVPKAIEQSLDGVQRVARIVQAMKEFSHPGSESKTSVDLNHAIESTITVARNEWKYVSDVVTDFDPELPPVPCLPGQFNQVILNILINAAHAIADVVGDGRNGKGTITVSTRRDNGSVEVRITDTGTGIPEAARGKIFDPFFTTKPVGKGSGQGLAIAHSVVVDKHGGSIRFETEMGKGTTFIIHLPLGAQPAPKKDGKNQGTSSVR
ncbi:MAG TPA: ATP-binding protein [Verrucomicrobiae bacterium]|nr:ATP-binding protein [Verrucomicrobiae bacterium]